jgi:serine protease Do
MRTFIVVASLALLSACASGYSKAYTDLTDAQSERPTAARAAPTVVPSSGNYDRDIETMWQRGFVLVGYSSFDGYADTEDALDQARRVGAERVVQYSRAEAAGGGGEVAYVPTTTLPIDRYEQTVFYFARMGPSCFGALFASGTDAQKRAIGTNSVAVVRAVRDASPAFLANLLPGDLILSLGGFAVSLDAPPWTGKTGQTMQMIVARATPDKAGYRMLDLPITLGQCA